MADEIIKNVVFRTRVEAEPSPGAKETADSIRAITDAEKQGVTQADQYTAAQGRAASAATQQGQAYDANAKKMSTMFTVIRDGTKNVLAYVALDGQIRKVDASFRAGADGGVKLAQQLGEVGSKSKEVGGDLDALKEKAAKLRTPSVAAPAVQVPQVPGAGQGVSAEVQATILAMDGLSAEAKELALELLNATQGGAEGMELLRQASEAEFNTLKQVVDLLRETPQGQEALAGQLTGAQQGAVDLLVSIGAIKEEQRGVVEEATKLLNAQQQNAEAGRATNEVFEQQLGILDQYAARIELLKQKRASVQDPEELARVGEELKKVREEFDRLQKSGALPPVPDPTIRSYTTLRTQLQEAKARLDALVESSGGRITPEIIAAAQAAGQLQDRFEDINATVNAFNPDKRFQVLTGVVQNALGAFTALQGAIALVGVESEGTERALLKVQSALAITQGLQALFGGLRDNLRNIRLLLTGAVTQFQTLYAVQLRNAAATSAGTIATTGFGAALARARAFAMTLWATLLANPLVAIAAGISAVVLAVIAFSDETEEAEQTVDDFFDTLDRRSREAERNRKFRESTATIEAEIAFLKSKQTAEDKLALTRAQNAAAEEQARQALADKDKELNETTAKRIDLLNKARDAKVREAQAAVAGGGAGNIAPDPEATERRQRIAGEEAAAEFIADIRGNLTEEQIQDLDKLEEKERALTEERMGLSQELDLTLRRSEKAEIEGLNAVEDERKRIAKENADRLKGIPLSGSIAAFQKELERLKKLANEVPQDAFAPEVLASIKDAIAKAESDLAKAQETFADRSAETLNERQRAALALAELDAREAQNRLRATGASAAEIAQAEQEGNDRRFAIALQGEQDRLKLMQDSGKATAAEITAQQNKIAELERNRGVTKAEGSTTVDAEVVKANLAELEERKRHTLAIADLDSQAAIQRAQNEGRSQADIQAIERQAHRERLALEIDFELESLRIMQDSGQKTAAEVQAQINRLKELRAELNVPEPDDTQERLQALIASITDAADQIAQAGIGAWKAWSDAAAASIDQQIALQRQRVEDAKEIADKGNAEILRAEEKRLRDLTDARARAAERTAAIAQVEAAAEAAVAIARVAAQSATLGPFGVAVGIAAALISLTAGLIQARQMATASVPSFRKGGPFDWSTAGGYTGDGHPDAESVHLGAKPYRYHRREFIMPDEVTSIGNNRAWFQRIMTGRINVDQLINPRGVVRIDGGGGGMTDGQVNRIVQAVREQPGATVQTRIDKDGIAQMVTGRNLRNKMLRRK